MTELTVIENEGSLDIEINIEAALLTYDSSSGILSHVLWYTATGTEGNTLTIDGSLTVLVNGVETNIDLRGRTVTAVNNDNYELKPTLLDNPTPKEFNWNSTTAVLTLANDLESEQIKITYI